MLDTLAWRRIEGAVTLVAQSGRREEFTLCFIQREQQVLMLHRRKPPHQGMWNGVGGRLEPGEEPLQGCLREVAEETGLSLRQCRFGGVVGWSAPGAPLAGRMFVFLAEAGPGEPRPCAEGELAWQPLPWVLSSPEVVSNIRIFLPPMLAGECAQLWHFYYVGEALVGFERQPLAAVPVGCSNPW